MWARGLVHRICRCRSEDPHDSGELLGRPVSPGFLRPYLPAASRAWPRVHLRKGCGETGLAAFRGPCFQQLRRQLRRLYRGCVLLRRGHHPWPPPPVLSRCRGAPAPRAAGADSRPLVRRPWGRPGSGNHGGGQVALTRIRTSVRCRLHSCPDAACRVPAGTRPGRQIHAAGKAGRIRAGPGRSPRLGVDREPAVFPACKFHRLCDRWIQHVLANPLRSFSRPVSRAGTPAGSSAMGGLTAAGAWRIGGSWTEAAAKGNLVLDAPMAFCWPSRAMFALATPGKRGLIQHGIPVRPDSRPGDSPASANFHLRTEERLPEKGPRHGAQFGCGTLRAGLMPLANAGIAVVRWRTSAERWRREDFWTEAVPVSVVPSWHGTWVRRGPRAPVFPNRETHHPAPGRPGAASAAGAFHAFYGIAADGPRKDFRVSRSAAFPYRSVEAGILISESIGVNHHVGVE